MSATALSGIRVVDFTASFAGPYCTLVLGALGAEIVKIEHPQRGDDTRAWGPPFWEGESAAFLSMNANKRSIGLDVKAPEGLEIARSLISRSDVFVQNMRPGLVERLGLGYEDLRVHNGGLIYCSIGAFGREGPLRDQPGYDPLMQAAGGIMSLTGEAADRPRVRLGISAVDQGTGMWSVIGILAALRNRDEGGGGQLVDTSLYEQVRVWSRSQSTLDDFAAEVAADCEGLPIELMDDLEATVRGADVVVTVTPSTEPLVADLWVHPGTHLACIGGGLAGSQELEPAILKRARIFTDDIRQCQDDGEINVPLANGELSLDDVAGDFGAVVAGKLDGRESADQITVFDSTGIALQDSATVPMEYERALEAGVGVAKKMIST